VSPERTFSPGPNSTAAAARTARFLTWSSRSTLAYPTAMRRQNRPLVRTLALLPLKPLIVLASLLAAGTLFAQPQKPAAKPEGAAHPGAPAAAIPAIAVPEAMAVQGIPPIPRQKVVALTPYENIRTAVLAGWHPRERRLLIRTRFAD